jgi:hypothetical protein
MTRIFLIGILAAIAAMAYSSRRELMRYLTIRWSANHPNAVGRSITAQGNEAALNLSEGKRRAAW